MMEHVKNMIRAGWEVTDLGEPCKILRVEIDLTPNVITISQCKYIESILKKEGMLGANAVGMPMDPNINLERNPEANEPNCSNAYATLLGELQHIANMSRPEISFSVNRLAAYTANPCLRHYT